MTDHLVDELKAVRSSLKDAQRDWAEETLRNNDLMRENLRFKRWVEEVSNLLTQMRHSPGNLSMFACDIDVLLDKVPR